MILTEAEMLSIKRECVLYMEEYGYKKVWDHLPKRFRNRYLNLLGNFRLFIKRSKIEEESYIAKKVNYIILTTRHERMNHGKVNDDSKRSDTRIND